MHISLISYDISQYKIIVYFDGVDRDCEVVMVDSKKCSFLYTISKKIVCVKVVQ